MVRDIVHDPVFLALKSQDATKEDLWVAQDLLDTLLAHKEECVGMAGNMIGERKRIIAFLDEKNSVVGCKTNKPNYTVLFNAEIIKKEGAYEAEEGCLSLLGGVRKCRRYKTIRVRYQTAEMQTRSKTYTGFTAQIIQHEIDHCNGVLI